MQSIFCSHAFWILSGGWLFLSRNEKKRSECRTICMRAIFYELKREEQMTRVQKLPRARAVSTALWKSTPKRYLFWSKCKQGSGVCIVFSAKLSCACVDVHAYGSHCQKWREMRNISLRWTVHDGSLFFVPFSVVNFFFWKIFNSFVFLIETIRYWTFFPMQGQWSKVQYAHFYTLDGVGWFEAYQQRLSPAMITKSCFRRVIVVFVLIIEFGSPFLDILSPESIFILKYTQNCV